MFEQQQTSQCYESIGVLRMHGSQIIKIIIATDLDAHDEDLKLVYDYILLALLIF